MRHAFLSAGALCLLLGTAACREREEPVAEPAPPEPTLVDGTEVEVFRPEPQRRALPAGRIYYTLTDYEWYARGEPLVHDGRPYAAARPVAASADSMQRLGDYQGVEYYGREGDPDSAVYVPVFEGWWLAFRAGSAAAGSQPRTR